LGVALLVFYLFCGDELHLYALNVCFKALGGFGQSVSTPTQLCCLRMGFGTNSVEWYLRVNVGPVPVSTKIK